MHVGHWRRRKVIQRNRLYYDLCLRHLVRCQLHWRCRVHRLMPHASSVSKLQNARVMRSLASCVDCVQRRQAVKTVSGSRMRPTGTLVSWTSVTNRNRPLAIMMCSSIPWATAHPRSLRPTSSIGSTMARRAGAKDWLSEAHKSDEFVFESLCPAFMVIGEFEPRQGQCRFGHQSRVVSSSFG